MFALDLRWRNSWVKLHPEWDYRLWTDEDVADYPFETRTKELFDRMSLILTMDGVLTDFFLVPHFVEDSNNFAEKSDIWRYSILFNYGGLYIDTDFECLKSFDDLHCLSDCGFYSGLSNTGTVEVNIGLLASVPRHPLLRFTSLCLCVFESKKWSVFCFIGWCRSSSIFLTSLFSPNLILFVAKIEKRLKSSSV